MLLLGGCSSVSNLSNNEIELVAEYIAGTMLKYDKNYEEALVEVEGYKEEVKAVWESQPLSTPTLTTTPTPTPTITTTTSDEVENTATANSSMDEVIGDDKVEVKYKSNKTYTSFPKNSKYFSVDAAEGNELIVITFELENQSTQTKVIDLINKDINYQLRIGNKTLYKPLLTLLTNDVQFLNITLEPNTTTEAVLVFEVPDKANKDEIDLIIADDNKTAIISIE